MASDAEIDLIVNATGTLSQLERDLDRVVRAAQADASPVNIAAILDQTVALQQVDRQLQRVINSAQANADPVTLQAALNQQQAIRQGIRDLDRVANRLSADGVVDPIALTAALNVPRTLATVRRELDAVVTAATRTADPIRIRTDVDSDRVRRAVADIDIDLGRLTRSALGAAGAIGKIAAPAVALGGAVPVVASLAAAVQNIVPAAAVATQGILAMQLASGTLKLGLLGVADAVTAAFDPKTKPEDLAKQIKALAPEAQKFVKELIGMRDGFKDLQLDVQNRLFKDLDSSLKTTANAVLPDVSDALKTVASTLNEAGREAATAASKLGKDGTLGRALDGATAGLNNLKDVPGQAVTALGQLAAAAGPAFDRVTEAAAGAATDISKRLDDAFKSRALDQAIDDALNSIKQLGTVGGNILGGLRNIFGGLTEDGGGLFDTLEQISQAFEDLTASQEFQTILSELSTTADALVKNVLPLLLQAFQELAPVFAIIGPPIQDFINQVGPELTPLIEQLGPILVDLADILRDQMPFAIKFTIAAIEAIIVILQGLDFILDEIVIPVLHLFAEAMDSDVVKAAETMSGILEDTFGRIFEVVETFRKDTIGSLSNFSDGLGRIAIDAAAKFVDGMLRLVQDTQDLIAGLPGAIRGALGDLGGLLFSAGQAVISGFIDGIESRISEIAGVLGGITDRLPDWKGPADVDSTILFKSGQLVMQGFQAGIASQVDALAAQLGSLTMTIPSSVGAGLSVGASSLNAPQPVVQVFLGNELVNNHIDTRVNMANDRNMRIAAQGVRR